jgi:hypothetical protein
MSALPVHTGVHEPGLSGRLQPLHDRAIAQWHATPADLPVLGPHVSRYGQWTNARETSHLVDELAARIEHHPQDGAEQHAWREAVRHRLSAFGESRLGWPGGYRRLLFGDAFYESAVAFARCARAFDPALPLEDLLQALRNVWIANSLQSLCARPVSLTPGLFAYSMLYPVTDNLLDAPDVTGDDKHAFNARFGRRLRGERLAPSGGAESAAFALVARMEGDLPRWQWPDAWASILEIHRAQAASMRQHQRAPLSGDELLELSVAKGGASVLADMYLIAPDATLEQERFAFGYGVFLQLLDDLQDISLDLARGHQTLFTHAARHGALDEPAAQLARFIDRVLDSAPHGHTIAHRECIDLIRRNCLTLLVAVVASEPGRFSRRFRRAIERQWSMRLGALRRLRTRAGLRYAQTARRLRERHNVDSPLELLLRGT